jgi:hypothetical protein
VLLLELAPVFSAAQSLAHHCQTRICGTDAGLP